MKNLAFFILGLLSVQTLTAQNTATNNTEEVWYVSCYGGNTTVPANESDVSLNVGTNCALGIQVKSAMCSTPHIFTAPSTWTAECSSETDEVIFTGDIASPPPSCPGYASDIFENIEIIFVPE